MADAFSPQAVTHAVLDSVRQDLFVKGYMGLGRMQEVLGKADVGGGSAAQAQSAAQRAHNARA